MTRTTRERLHALGHNALRIAAGLMFFSHGAQKLLGWFGGFGPGGGTADLSSRFGIAGIIELVGGALVTVGLFTRPAAFIMSGEMAVAYFWMHAYRSESLWWWANRGEVVALYSFIWFFIIFAGPGSLSLDAWLSRRRGDAPPPG